MTQRNFIGGNVMVPATDHIGFGIPTNGTDVSTNARIILVSGDPNGAITAPIGSFALDETTPGLWQNTDGATAWSAVGGAAGGMGVLPMRDGALVDPDHPNAVDNTDLNTPFVTIQGAIDAIEATALAASGGAVPYSSAAQKKTYTVIVAQGIYDESLVIGGALGVLSGLSFNFVARGTVILGNGANSQLVSTNTRDITWNLDRVNHPANFIWPTLAFTIWPKTSTNTSAGAPNLGSWRVSGRLFIESIQADGGDQGFLLLDSVRIDDVAATGNSIVGNVGASDPLIQAVFNHCNFPGSVIFSTAGSDLNRAEDSVFGAALTIRQISRMTRCVLSGNVTTAASTTELIDCFPGAIIWTGNVQADDTTLSRATVLGSFVGTITNLSGPVAIADPGDLGVIPVVGDFAVGLAIVGAGETNTMADPNYLGQRCQINVHSLGGGATRAITVPSPIAEGAPSSVMTFTAATNWIILECMNTSAGLRWRIIENNGVGLS